MKRQMTVAFEVVFSREDRRLVARHKGRTDEATDHEMEEWCRRAIDESLQELVLAVVRQRIASRVGGAK